MSTALPKEMDRFKRFRDSMNELLKKGEAEFAYNDYESLAIFSFENACYEYTINHDIQKFFTLLNPIPHYIIRSYELGLKSDDNNLEGWNWKDYYIPGITYPKVYYALAGKNLIGASALAHWFLKNGFFEKMPNYEDRYYYGYCLLYLLANDSKFWPTYNKLKKKKNKKTIPYVKIYEGIVEKSESLAQEGIDELVLVMNKNWEDEHTGFINTWALGLANLCRLNGVMVHESKQNVPKMLIPANEVTPQVPEELLVTPEEVKAVLEKDPALGQLPAQ